MASGWRAQFSRPSGLGGWVVGHLMAVKNRERSEWVISRLGLTDQSRVLEVGFGPGVDVRRVARQSAFVAGVDHSSEMVRQARRRNAHAIAAGRVDLRLGSAEALPFPDGSFDVAFAINVMSRPSTLARVVYELVRVLRPGGLVAVAFQPRMRWADEETVRLSGEMFRKVLLLVGLQDLRLETKVMRPAPVACVSGRTPSPAA